MLRCLDDNMRTTLSIEDALYKKLVEKSLERYGSMRHLSELINELLAGSMKQEARGEKPMVGSKWQVASGNEQRATGHKPLATSYQPLPRGRIETYILHELEEKGGLLFAVIDPMDYSNPGEAVRTAKNANDAGCDIILIGGSTGVQGEMLDGVAKMIKENVNVPVVLFPGNIGTLTKYADAVYFMSLLNSRNPYWISGAQMLAAPNVKLLGVEPLPTGYIVVEPGGTVGHVGEANRIPRDKPKLAAALALAAQYMGFRFVVTDAGSNPKEGHIPLEMVAAVSKTIDIPYIVAGGIRTPEQARNVIAAGADILQVGTAFEKNGNVSKIKEMVNAVREGATGRKR